MNFYGVGTMAAPTKVKSRASRGRRRSAGQKAVFSTLTRTSTPSVTGGQAPDAQEELQYHSRGCYTAVSAIKRYNRLCENLLMDAELSVPPRR